MKKDSGLGEVGEKGMDGLSGISLGDATPAGLLAVGVLLIFAGRLVPRSTLRDTIKDRDEWRNAHKTSEAARIELQQQVAELLEHSRTTEQFIRSIPIAVATLKEREEDP